MTDPAILTVDQLAPPAGVIDETCAGIPLNAWRRGDPYDGVMTAIRYVAAHPDLACIAYCHDPSPQQFGQTDRRQREAGRAWAAREYPHLDIRLRSRTLPYRGIGNDVVVMFAEVVRPRKTAIS